MRTRSKSMAGALLIATLIIVSACAPAGTEPVPIPTAPDGGTAADGTHEAQSGALAGRGTTVALTDTTTVPAGTQDPGQVLDSWEPPPPGTVLHARATTRALTPADEGAETLTHELWYAGDGDGARYVVRDALGGLMLLETRSGRVAVRWQSNPGGMPGVSASVLPEHASGAGLTGAGRMLPGQWLTDWVGPESLLQPTLSSLDGQPVVHVVFPELEDTPGSELWIAPDTGLTLRQTLVEPGSEGVVQVTDWDYSVVEYVPTSAVTPTLFTELPPEAEGPTDIRGTWSMSTDEAAQHAGFKVYWLGETFADVELDQIEAIYSAPTAERLFELPRPADVHSIFVYYTNPPVDVSEGTASDLESVLAGQTGLLQLHQESMVAVVQREGPSYAPAQNEDAIVIGDAVVVHETGGEARIALGGTHIDAYVGPLNLQTVVEALHPLTGR